MYVLAFSSDRDDLVPPSKNIVRAFINVIIYFIKYLQIGGWKIQPMAEDPNKTLCTYMVEMDLKGSIPGFVLT